MDINFWKNKKEKQIDPELFSSKAEQVAKKIFEEQQTEQDNEHWEVAMSDSLLLFTRESNEQFLIYIDNVSIAGSVLFVADKVTVQDVLSGKNYNLVQELR